LVLFFQALQLVQSLSSPLAHLKPGTPAQSLWFF
jgi:hypothetical protein